jgi:hypothetical protein
MALVGALVAVVATKVVLGIIGFVAGGGIALLLLGNLGIDRVVALAIYLIAGVIGAVLLLVLFDWTLIVLSSLAGASLIVMSVERLLQDAADRRDGARPRARGGRSLDTGRPLAAPAAFALSRTK